MAVDRSDVMSEWLGHLLRRRWRLILLMPALTAVLALAAVLSAGERYASLAVLSVGQVGLVGFLEPPHRVLTRVEESLRTTNADGACTTSAALAEHMVRVEVSCADAELAMQRASRAVEPVVAAHRALFEAALGERARQVSTLEQQLADLDGARGQQLAAPADPAAAASLARTRFELSKELQRLREASLQMFTHPTELLSAPRAAAAPSPRRWALVVLAAVLGGALGLGGAVLREAMHPAARVERHAA